MDENLDRSTGADEPVRGDLVCIARFFDAARAHIARSVLDSEGVFACLDAESSNTMMSHVGTALGGVKLLVQADQVEKAKAILSAHSESDLDDEETEAADESDDEEEESPELRERSDHVRRAWTAAIVGLLLCPPALNVYSFYLLMRHGLLINDPRWPNDWRINAALLVNLAALGIVGLFFSTLF